MKIIISLIVIALIFLGGLHLKGNGFGSAVGTRFTTQRIEERILLNSSTTMAYLLNGSASDRVIAEINYYFNDHADTIVSGSAWSVQAATSTERYTLNSNTNFVLDNVIATSSDYLYVSSTTPGLTATDSNRVWKTKTYLNFLTSDIGTTTMTGFFIIKYYDL